MPTATICPPSAFTSFKASGFGRDRAVLGMHAMIFRIRRPHRQEGAGADVKRDEMLGNATIGDRAEQLVAK